MKMIAFRYFFFSLFLMLIACKSTPIEPSEPIPTEPKAVEWQSVQGLKGDNYSMVKLFATPQKLLILGDNYVIEVDSAHRIVREEKFSERRIVLSYGKIETNGAFFTYFDANVFSSNATKIIVRSVKSPKSEFEIDVTKIDTNYRSIGVNNSSSPGVLTQDNRLFLPVVYSPSKSDFTNAELRFLIFKIQLVGNALQVAREPDYIPVALTSPTNFRKTFFLATLNLPKPTDNYLYFSAWETYRMDVRTGRYEPVLNMFSSHFVYKNDTLWSFGRRLDVPFVFSYLAPQQADWSVFSTNLVSQTEQWFSVDKHIIGLYYGSALALFTSKLDSNKIQIRTLADSNIPIIRDVVAFNDRVYLATTQGLVVKPLKDFIVFSK